MEVRAIADPAEFLESAGPLLLPAEARHNLILGIAGTLVARPGFYPDYRLWVVLDDGEPQAAALMTVPFRIVLSDVASDPALDPLVAAVRADGVSVPGVVGNRPTVETFVDRWTAVVGGAAELSMAQGVFALDKVETLSPVSGRPRRADRGDRDLVLDWYTAFSLEAFTGEGPVRDLLERSVDLHLDGDDSSVVWLWEDDGETVALAASGGRTPHGARIGPVYTPPPHRGRGYASAVVAALSSWLLASGRDFCFLYTDLANPTSNSIYRRIGYHQVAESAEFEFNPVE